MLTPIVLALLSTQGFLFASSQILCLPCRLHKSASVVDIDPQSMREVCPPLFQPLVHQQLPPLANTQNTEVLRSTVRVTAIRLVSLDGSSSPGKASNCSLSGCRSTNFFSWLCPVAVRDVQARSCRDPPGLSPLSSKDPSRLGTAGRACLACHRLQLSHRVLCCKPEVHILLYLLLLLLQLMLPTATVFSAAAVVATATAAR